MKEEYERIGSEIINAAYEVHKELGPGLFESVYEFCFMEELRKKSLAVKKQVKVPLWYKGEKLGKDFFLDILVEDKILVELKAVELLLPIHEVQTLTYMKLSGIRLGYLINFHEVLIKNGIRRKINGYL